MSGPASMTRRNDTRLVDDCEVAAWPVTWTEFFGSSRSNDQGVHDQGLTRAIRSWLTPAITFTRWWQAWTDTDPPHELQALIDAVTTGQGIDLYLRI